jgi:hypothetical protein
MENLNCNTNIKKIIIKDENDFKRIEEIWLKLEKGKDLTVFQSYKWNILLFNEWLNLKHYRFSSEVVIYYNERIILPLIIQKLNLLNIFLFKKKGIYFLGYDSYSDYLNFIYDDVSEIEFSQFLCRVKNDYPNLEFHIDRIIENTKLDTFLKKKNTKFIKTSIAVEVLINNQVDNYNARLSKSTKQNLRTSLNRMNRDNINYELNVNIGSVDDRIIKEILPIHFKRVMQINSKADCIKKKISNIYRKVSIKKKEKNTYNVIRSSMKSMENGILVYVKLNNKIVSYIYGFIEKDVIRIAQNCIDDKYKFYSPMTRGIYDFIIKYHGTYKCIDFTRGTEEYKYKLGGVEKFLNSYII